MDEKIIEFTGQKWLDAYLYHLKSPRLPIWNTVSQISSDSIVSLMRVMSDKGVIFTIERNEWAKMSEVEKFTMLSIEGGIVIQYNSDTGVGEIEIIDSPEQMKKHIEKWS
jgi:hypothetical protein